ncbi:hypothetical protein [Nocardia testacea]|uniref:Uncharacterized protein n=1 Tax=Nocardia testacea TaxID=248551 RepID=A0ABW7VWL4_9NOCA
MPKPERQARLSRGEIPTPRLWFRADAVSYDILEDVEGQPIGLSFNSKPPDYAQHSTWAKASDLRVEREYEVADNDAVRDWEGQGTWIDRARTTVVPAPWHHPDRPDAKPIHVRGHGNQHRFTFNIQVGREATGIPKHMKVAVNGHVMGNYLAGNPDFWYLLQSRGGDVLFHNCSIAADRGTAFRLAATPLRDHGVEVPLHGASSTTITHANDASGWPEAHPDQNVDGGVAWDPDPSIASLYVLPGKAADGNPQPGRFVTLRPRVTPACSVDRGGRLPTR